MAKISIGTDHNSYRLRWTYQGKRYSLSIGDINKQTLKAAEAKAKLIESDILFDRFDTSLSKYSARHKQQTQAETILTAWERYKELNSNRVAVTTQKECWSQVDRCLARVKHKRSLLSLNKADELVNELLKYYSPGTLKRVLIDINAAIGGYYPLKRLPKTSKPLIECFTNFEIKTIIEAFESNEFQSVYSDYAHDYYFDYVSFLAHTGCRPEEAIVLDWHSVDLDNRVVRFDKAYSKGTVKQTKNYQVRDFPINEQLEIILKNNYGKSIVCFPSVSGGYINHRDWSRRYWRPIVRSLASQSRINKYLKPYCLRHSFITRCIRSSIDIATVAKLAGTSTEMIMRNYLASRDISQIKLPDF